MFVEIKDLQSNEFFKVTQETVFGRNGGDADFGLADQAVSKRHARIVLEGSKFFLEDLKSSNGTFVEEKRLEGRVELQLGLNFRFSRYAFVVSEVVGDHDAEATAMLDVSQAVSVPSGSTVVTSVPKASTFEPAAEPETVAPKASSLEEKSTSVGGRREASVPKNVGHDGSSSAKVATAENKEGLVGAVMSALPVAFAFYVKTTPKLFFRPRKTIEELIKTPQVEALNTGALVGWALMSMLAMGLVSIFTPLLMALASRSFSPTLLISPLITVAVSLVAAVIIGFVFHPVLKFVVSLLKGDSDELNRSNYFVTIQSVLPLFALPALSGALVAVVLSFVSVQALTILNIAPLLLSFYCSLILLAAGFFWFKSFKVMSWVPVVFLALMALSLVGAVQGSVATVRGAFSSGTGVGLSGAASAELNAAMEKASAKLEDKTNAPGTVTQEAKVTGNGAEGQGTEKVNQAETSASDSKTGKSQNEVDKKPSADVTNRDGTKSTVEVVEKAVATGGNDSATPSEMSYDELLVRGQKIRAAIEKDPSLLATKGIKDTYLKWHQSEEKVLQKYKKKRGKVSKLQEQLRKAELYEQTASMVQSMYSELF